LGTGRVLLRGLDELLHIRIEPLLVRDAHLGPLAAVGAAAPGAALELAEELGSELARREIHEGVAHAHVASAGQGHLQKVDTVADSPDILQEPLLSVLAGDVLDHERGELGAGSGRARGSVGGFAVETWGGLRPPQRNLQRFSRLESNKCVLFDNFVTGHG